ncbi:CPBP family intramembrane glutamic endopeptidase [Agromyces arachidis]|uniref:CPBP family intramembrane glutamic endopeptidase n=1 Tax=Agromyces arachidis TaxID=766966 RepID=UPI0040575768
MRVSPRPWIGFAVVLAYMLVGALVWILTGVDYPRISESAGTLLLWYVLPLAVGAVLLIVATSLLGWWRPALFEKRPGPRWIMVGPVLMIAVAIGVLLGKDLSQVPLQMWVLATVGSILVGFCEELLTRGILLVALRGRFRELLSWFLSTLMFGLMHLPNLFFGQTGAIVQVFLAFASGTMLYLARRSSGTLIFAMAVHAIWDFAQFTGVRTEAGDYVGVLGSGALNVLALILLIFSLRADRGAKVEQYGVEPGPDVPARV